MKLPGATAALGWLRRPRPDRQSIRADAMVGLGVVLSLLLNREALDLTVVVLRLRGGRPYLSGVEPALLAPFSTSVRRLPGDGPEGS